MLAVMITLVFALLPEAESLANQTCLLNYNSQAIFRNGRIIYYSQSSLELMGQTNCLVLDMSKCSQGKKKDGGSKAATPDREGGSGEGSGTINDAAEEDVFKSLAYLLQIQGF